MRVNLPVLYSQFDPQWKNSLIGFNTDPKYNFYNFGCLQACLAVITRYFQKDDTPQMINDKLKAVGGFVADTGLYLHGSISKIYPDITQNYLATPGELTNEQLQGIRSALDNHLPVMVKIDYNPKTLDRDDHFVVIVDYNPKDENDFTIFDPLGGIRRSLKDYLGMFRPSARKSIQSISIFSGPVPAVQEQPQAPVLNPEPVAPPIVNPQPQAGALPPNYSDIVHGSTQWDEIVKYLELGKLAKEAVFEDAKRVIAGLKSAKTDYYNKQIKAEKEAAENAVTITNQEETINRLKEQVLQTEKLNKAEIDSIKNNTPSIESLQKQYEGVIAELRASLQASDDTVKDLRIELAKKQIDEGSSVEPQVEIKGSPTGILALFKRFLVLK